QEETLRDPVRFQRPTALALGAIALAEVIYLGGHEWATGRRPPGAIPITGGGHAAQVALGGNVERVARTLFTDFLWPFEITAALLVVAVVGSVVLARRSGQRLELTPEPELDDAGDAAP